MHRSQRTGLATWRDQPARRPRRRYGDRPPVLVGDVRSAFGSRRSARFARLDELVHRGGHVARCGRRPPPSAGPPRRLLRLVLGSARPAAPCVPAATIWPAPFTFAGVSPRLLQVGDAHRRGRRRAARTCRSRSPRRPRPSPAAAAHEGQSRPVSSRTPAKTAAVISPTLWPPRRRARSRHRVPRRTGRPAATSSGWATWTCPGSRPRRPWCRSGRGRVPMASDHAATRSAAPGRSSQGSQEAGRLGALAGSDEYEHSHTLS